MLLRVWRFFLYCEEMAMKLCYAGLRTGVWNTFENYWNEFGKVFIYFVLIS